MSDSTCSVTPSGVFQYMPGAGLSGFNFGNNCDFDYIDMSSSMYPGSIFGAYPATGFDLSGIGSCMPGGGGFNNQSYFDNMKQYQQFYNKYYIEQQKMNRNADLQINGSMESIQETAANLKDKIMQNEQDQVMEAYTKFVECVRNAYGEGSQEDINSRALSLYRQYTGKSLIQDLRENSHGSALQGFIQSITLGMYSRKSAEDNIAEITGQSVPTGEKTSQNVGRVAGVATVGSVAYGCVRALAGRMSSVANFLQRNCRGRAAWIGLGAAGLAAAMTLITGKISS